QIATVLTGYFIGGCGSLLRRSAYAQTEGQTEKYKWHADWFYLLVMAFRHGCCFVPADLCANRVSKTSYSAASQNDTSGRREVMRNIITALKTQYRDIMPYFARSGVLSLYADRLLEMFRTYPDMWDSESAALIQHLTFDRLIANGGKALTNESSVVS